MCPEPAGTGIGAVRVERGGQTWPNKMSKHTHTEKLETRHPNLVQIVVQLWLFSLGKPRKKGPPRRARAPRFKHDTWYMHDTYNVQQRTVSSTAQKHRIRKQQCYEYHDTTETTHIPLRMQIYKELSSNSKIGLDTEIPCTVSCDCRLPW